MGTRYQTVDVLVDIERVEIFPRATLGHAWGRIVGEWPGELTELVGDPRALAAIGEVIEESGEPVRAAVPRWGLLR